MFNSLSCLLFLCRFSEINTYEETGKKSGWAELDTKKCNYFGDFTMSHLIYQNVFLGKMYKNWYHSDH